MRALSLLEQYSLRTHDGEVRTMKMTVTAKAPVAKKTSSKSNKTMDDTPSHILHFVHFICGLFVRMGAVDLSVGMSTMYRDQDLLPQRLHCFHCSVSTQADRLHPVLFDLFKRADFAYLRRVSLLG